MLRLFMNKIQVTKASLIVNGDFSGEFRFS